eukprot:6187755-Pleurochrysis_carterae.AAC.4
MAAENVCEPARARVESRAKTDSSVLPSIDRQVAVVPLTFGAIFVGVVFASAGSLPTAAPSSTGVLAAPSSTGVFAASPCTGVFAAPPCTGVFAARACTEKQTDAATLMSSTNSSIFLSAAFAVGRNKSG